MKADIDQNTAKRAAPKTGRRAPASAVKSSLEYALLGLIAEMPGISGYDIVKIFNLSMRHFWHAHQGQIYPTLERMQRDGWIRSREVIQRGRPNKRLFSSTAEGERALERWLRSPLEDMKLKFAPLLRTRFLGHLGCDEARAQLEEQRTGCIEYLEELRRIEREYFAGSQYASRHMMFSHFTLRYGIAWMEESIRWCEWATGVVNRNSALFAVQDRARRDTGGQSRPGRTPSVAG